MKKIETGLGRLCIREITLKYDYAITIHYNTTVPDAKEICFVVVQYFVIRPELVYAILKSVNSISRTSLVHDTVWLVSVHYTNLLYRPRLIDDRNSVHNSQFFRLRDRLCRLWPYTTCLLYFEFFHFHSQDT